MMLFMMQSVEAETGLKGLEAYRNHRIVLKEVSENQCLYSDIVEIGAGWKTIFIYLWAKCFYAHRQRKWVRLLKKIPCG